MHERIDIELGERSYPILIGPRLAAKTRRCSPRTITARNLLIVTNETVAPLYLAKLQSALAAAGASRVVLPDGEQHKTLDELRAHARRARRRAHESRRVPWSRWAAASSVTWPASPPPAISAASTSCRCRRRCWRKSIRRSAARPASITRAART